MIEIRTVVDRIEISRDGSIGVRLAKEIVNDGIMIATQHHRTALAPGHDIDAQMTAVNSNLEGIGAAAVTTADIGRIRAAADTFWTPEVIAEHRARVAAADAARRAAEADVGASATPRNR